MDVSKLFHAVYNKCVKDSHLSCGDFKKITQFCQFSGEQTPPQRQFKARLFLFGLFAATIVTHAERLMSFILKYLEVFSSFC